MNYYSQVIPILLMVAIFYFLLLRPQQQRQKKHKLLLENLNTNDPVVTAGGIMGNVIKIKDQSVVIKGIDNTKFEVLKTHIAYINEAALTENEKADN